jgi:hypothetical protein
VRPNPARHAVDAFFAPATASGLRRTMAIVVVLLGLLGLLGRIYGLDRYSFWYDEWESIVTAQGLGASPPPRGTVFAPARWPTATVENVLASTVRHETPPAFALTLRAWISMFGVGRRACRSLSLLLDAICIAGIWAITRRHFGRHAAVLATAFFAVSPLAGDLALEVRAYALGGVIALTSTACLWRALRADHIAWWLAYGFLTAALGYVHYFALAIPLCQMLYVLVVARGRPLTRAMGAVTIAVALYLPWALTGLRTQWKSVGHVYEDISEKGDAGYSDSATPGAAARAVAYVGSALFGIDPALLGLRARLVAPPTAALVACVLWSGLRRWRLRSFVGLAAVTGLGPPLFLAAYSCLKAGVLVPMGTRHAYFGLPLIAVVFGAALGGGHDGIFGAPGERRRGLGGCRWAGFVLLLAASVGAVGQLFVHPKKSKHSAVEWAVGRAKDEPDALILFDEEMLAMEFTALRNAPNDQLIIAGWDDAELHEACESPSGTKGFRRVIFVGSLRESLALGRFCGYRLVASSDDGEVVAAARLSLAPAGSR